MPRHANRQAPNLPTETWLYTPVNKAPDAIPLAWAYPANTNISLSSLGYLALFREMDTHPGLAPVRVAADSLHQLSGQAFTYLGFSFSFELDILTMLVMLDALGIPALAKDRVAGMHPVVFAGGPVPTTNPEPYADFFDFFLIGDGEGFFDELVTAHQAVCGAGNTPVTNRTALLEHLTNTIAGIYVPSFYDVTYQGPEGPIAAIVPNHPQVPPVVQRRSAMNNQTVLSSPILSPDTIFANRFLVEVIRGCPHRCRFCLASYSTLPARTPELAPIIQAIETGLTHTPPNWPIGRLNCRPPRLCRTVPVARCQVRSSAGLVDFGSVFAGRYLDPGHCPNLCQGGPKATDHSHRDRLGPLTQAH
jgi:hypothetical protein